MRQPLSRYVKAEIPQNQGNQVHDGTKAVSQHWLSKTDPSLLETRGCDIQDTTDSAVADPQQESSVLVLPVSLTCQQVLVFVDL